MDETYIKIKGEWCYLYCAVDTDGKTVDFLLTVNCDRKAALGFFKNAMSQHGRPDTVTIDKSGANTAALSDLNEDTTDKITIRQSKYLNNLVEQDHQAVKRIVRPTLQGIELMNMIKKGQMIDRNCGPVSVGEPFYALAA